DVLRALRGTIRATDNPWNGWTLEWATPSPPPAYNFSTLPLIESSRPLWDLTHNATTAAAQTRDRAMLWRAQLVGIAAFIFSEATFFGALIVAYLEYRTRSPGPSPQDLDVPRTLIFSLFLFAS